MKPDFDIEELISDREKFNAFVYTPLDVAIKELEIRKNDSILKRIIDKTLTNGIPDIFKQEKCAVLHRQVITPNYEVRRFLTIVDALELNPIFFEYHNDKFVTESDWKYSLGNLLFFKGIGKKGGIKIDRKNIIDFNSSNGKKISDVKTLWNQDLVDFHHEMFLQRFPNMSKAIYNASDWYHSNGGTAKNYYFPFLLFFIRNGILFENFMLDVKEKSFTRDIFLPAFIKVIEITGKKPLIVALEPTDIEGDNFWNCHPQESMPFVLNRISKVK